MYNDQGLDRLFDALAEYPLPAGVYVVRKQEDGHEAIVNCNAVFAAMFGYDSPQEIIGLSPLKMHFSVAEYRKFMSQLVSSGGVDHYTELLRKQDGSSINVEIHCRLDYDEHQQVIGRTGVVSEHSAFERYLENVSIFTHHFTSTMIGFEKRIDAMHDAFMPDPFGVIDVVPESNIVAQHMEKPVTEFRNALKKLIDEVKDDEYKLQAFTPNDWETVVEEHAFLGYYKDKVQDLESRPAVLRMSARAVIDILRVDKQKPIKNETLRSILTKASEIERLGCLLDLHIMKGRLSEMNHEVKQLRETALVSAVTEEVIEEMRVSELMTQALQSLLPFATSKGVTIRIRDRTDRATVNVVQRNMGRALQNLVHNAIKYSWSKHDEPPWVEIRGRTDGTFAIIEVENYGVPIPKREIDEGFVFLPGVRGSMSGDRARTGTGIGLYDARQVARQHKGEVDISSVPADRYGKFDNLKQPYITIATLRIPLAVRGS